ncbi:uncharacterized protein LOC127731906 [Mytilus californianus]|uniref:uncharacterized protein LOC127731906 n=1 Tax=Mytilus californianus TaxID=6549 RepID=UPI0022477A3C|nr:uncharacterized protein LOC127731906 [Mytilus californianus]
MTKCCCLIVIILCTIGVSNSEGLTRKCRALNGKCGRKNVTCDDTFGSGWASEGRCCNERPCCKYSTVVTSYSCGFESDEPCIFKNSLEYDFAWTRTNNTSPTNNTGTLPQTPAKGNYYIYVELSSPAVGKAVLTTEAADLQGTFM